ncbi:hypothetical protein BU23DRAFT_550518 [Bimuria novae-zelandiae CBS 107.79]|uniref:Uncharacterized protein n=1 Tax=Bimuria novae-zelandiae CBS 107.79 TaxID=1447943 RepID=A0A6A5VKM4_9PLEO|nr:hypothetical protein BU23DRAFT_550518 [Bimuria novae-zelandiae CBS 107.79]
MADPFHFPEPSEHDPSSPTSPPESVLRRKKPFVPPGFAVSTTITSHGYQAGELHLLEDIKCHDHRQRYPEVEALVQMFFRIGAILLDLSVLIAVGILDAKSDVFTTAKTVYAVVSMSLQSLERLMVDVEGIGWVLAPSQHGGVGLARQSAA